MKCVCDEGFSGLMCEQDDNNKPDVVKPETEVTCETDPSQAHCQSNDEEIPEEPPNPDPVPGEENVCAVGECWTQQCAFFIDSAVVDNIIASCITELRLDVDACLGNCDSEDSACKSGCLNVENNPAIQDRITDMMDPLWEECWQERW